MHCHGGSVLVTSTTALGFEPGCNILGFSAPLPNDFSGSNVWELVRFTPWVPKMIAGVAPKSNVSFIFAVSFGGNLMTFLPLTFRKTTPRDHGLQNLGVRADRRGAWPLLRFSLSRSTFAMFHTAWGALQELDYEMDLTRFVWLDVLRLCWTFTLDYGLMGDCRSQHIFLNPAMLKTPFGVTYNCLNTMDNQKTFNDGYHIMHHMNSRTHWSELPVLFLKNLDQHAASEGILSL